MKFNRKIRERENTRELFVVSDVSEINTPKPLAQVVHDDPSVLLPLLADAKLLAQLHELTGVLVRVDQQQIHAPHDTATKQSGIGKTLCGQRSAMRGARITCQRCLASLQKGVQ